MTGVRTAALRRRDGLRSPLRAEPDDVLGSAIGIGDPSPIGIRTPVIC